MIITSYNEMARIFGNDKWKGLLKSHTDFQSQMSGRETKIQSKNSVLL